MAARSPRGRAGRARDPRPRQDRAARLQAEAAYWMGGEQELDRRGRGRDRQPPPPPVEEEEGDNGDMFAEEEQDQPETDPEGLNETGGDFLSPDEISDEDFMGTFGYPFMSKKRKCE